MRGARLLAAVVVATALMPPAHAQDRDAEIKALRTELKQARTTIQRLEKRLDEIQLAPVESPTPGQESATDQVPVVDMTRGDPAEIRKPASPTISVAGWELAPPGPIDRPLAPPREGSAAAFELAAGQGGGRASFALTRSKDRDAGSPVNGMMSAINDTFGLTFSAPLSEDGDTPFATLDGLASGTKLELEFTRFKGWFPTQESDDAHPLLQQARRDCLKRSPPYKPGCVRLNQEFLDEFMGPEEQKEYKRDYARKTLQRSWAWSLRAAVGYDKFEFYPVPTLVKSTTERVSFSVGGGLAFYPLRRTSFGIDLDYNHSFKASDAVPTCPVAAAGATTVTCAPGPVLGPEQTDKLILAPELRYLAHVSDSGLIRNLGFAPRVEANLLTGDVAFDFPIYFAADEKSGLIGGGRFGYLTDGKDFKFVLFVGKRFSIFR